MINEIYNINPGTLQRINQFKKFVGEDNFNSILQGLGSIDIPLDEQKYNELLNIVLNPAPHKAKQMLGHIPNRPEPGAPINYPAPAHGIRNFATLDGTPYNIMSSNYGVIIDYSWIPLSDAEEIVSFFCKPFAGKLMRQQLSTLDGISSYLQHLTPEALAIAMESFRYRNPNTTSTDASSSPKEISQKDESSTDPSLSHNSPSLSPSGSLKSGAISREEYFEQVITKAITILQESLLPDSATTPNETLGQLLGIFDNKELLTYLKA